MKFLIFLMFIIGVAYAWFSFYEPTPSGSSMQGVIQQFQEALSRGDVAAMVSVCDPSVQDDCSRLAQDIRDYTSRTGRGVGTVGSIGFDFPRGRRRVDGSVMVNDIRGETIINPTVAVEQSADGAPWRITVIN